MLTDCPRCNSLVKVVKEYECNSNWPRATYYTECQKCGYPSDDDWRKEEQADDEFFMTYWGRA